MTDAFATAITVSDPLRAIEEIELSIERLTVLFESNTTDFCELVVDHPGLPDGVKSAAYSIWLIYRLAIEKLEEIGGVVIAIDNRLHEQAGRAAFTSQKEG